MNIGQAIKQLRTHKGLSQVQVAISAGITQAALSQIENGKRPNVQTLQKISKALDVPESLIYVMGMEKGDVSEGKQFLYEQLFPVIQGLIKKIALTD